MRNVFFLLVLVNLCFAAWHSWYSPSRVPHSVDTDLPKLTLVSELPPEIADRRKANAAAPDVHLPEEAAVGSAPPSPEAKGNAPPSGPASGTLARSDGGSSGAPPRVECERQFAAERSVATEVRRVRPRAR